jgi:hypothetical protein
MKTKPFSIYILMSFANTFVRKSNVVLKPKIGVAFILEPEIGVAFYTRTRNWGRILY